MSTYYVIRSGTVRGEGLYYRGHTSQTRLLATSRRDAFTFARRADAERVLAELMPARIVKVTRRRRTPAEIRADERERCARICEAKAERIENETWMGLLLRAELLRAESARECASEIRRVKS